MRIACTDVAISSLASAIVASGAHIQMSVRLRGNRHTNLHEHGLHGRHRRPPGIGQELHAHRSTEHDVPTATLIEPEEAWTDDANVGRSEREVFVEADLEHDALDAFLLHLFGQGQLLTLVHKHVEGVQLSARELVSWVLACTLGAGLICVTLAVTAVPCTSVQLLHFEPHNPTTSLPRNEAGFCPSLEPS